MKRKKDKQESFNAHFTDVDHNGGNDWEVRLIDQTGNVKGLRKRESSWQHELDTFHSNGLNEREVALFLYLILALFCNFDLQYIL